MRDLVAAAIAMLLWAGCSSDSNAPAMDDGGDAASSARVDGGSEEPVDAASDSSGPDRSDASQAADAGLVGDGGADASPPAACVDGQCAGGFRCEGASAEAICVDIDECAADNGGCDELRACVNVPGGRTCGGCPEHYLDSGESGCSPVLLSLQVSDAALSPSFAGDVLEYRAGVALDAETVEVVATVAAGATLRVNGAITESASAWSSGALSIGENEITLEVAEAGRPSTTYTLIVSRGHEEARVTATEPAGGHRFGYSTALEGDTFVVGAHREPCTNGGNRCGAVYVYVRSGGTWSLQQRLIGSNTQGGDNFGVRVALSGDTLVVGATHEASNATGVNGNQLNNSASTAGAAYVFVRADGTWTQQAYLKASNTGETDAFGGSVAIDGDTIVVGAYQECSDATGVNGDESDNSSNFSGAAYVFVRDEATWSQQAYLKASDTLAEARFGHAAAIDGDTIVVGALISGHAYVFVRSADVWSQQALIDTERGLGSGESVALAGDVLVVGYIDSSSSSGDPNDTSLTRSGSAFVFERTGITWNQRAYLKASNPGEHDYFGYAVDTTGDKIIVGALNEDSSAIGVGGDATDNGATDSGAAYLFVRTGDTWSQHAYLKPSSIWPGGLFGISVAISGDAIGVGAARDVEADVLDAAYLFR